MPYPTATSKGKYNGYANAMHKLIAPETIKLNTYYTFNFNPSLEPYRDGHGYKTDSIPVYNSSMVKLFRRISKYGFHFKLVWEFSKLGRLHLHGVCYFTSENDIMNWYFNIVPLIIVNCSFEMDTIEDLAIWLKYVMKSEARMKPWCERHGLKYVIKSNDYVDLKVK